MTFKHFLLTRFNLGLYDRKQKTRDKKRIDPEVWMNNRIELVRKYTAPSIANQKSKNFVWIIVVDPQTSSKHFDSIVSLVPSSACVVEGENFRKTSSSTIEELLLRTNSKPDRVITSRIDADDAIHRSYIGTIQDWFQRKQRTGVLTFPKGLVYDSLKEKLYHLRYVKNHFLTFVEKRGPKPVRTVLRARHTALTDMFQTFKCETKPPLWLEVVHEDNLAKYSRGDRIPMSKLIRSDYGIS